MRVKLSYSVHGSTHEEITRRALAVICDYLQIQDPEEVKSKVEIEVEVTQVPINGETLFPPAIESFVGVVHARIK